MVSLCKILNFAEIKIFITQSDTSTTIPSSEAFADTTIKLMQVLLKNILYFVKVIASNS